MWSESLGLQLVGKLKMNEGNETKRRVVNSGFYFRPKNEWNGCPSLPRTDSYRPDNRQSLEHLRIWHRRTVEQIRPQ